GRRCLRLFQRGAPADILCISCDIYRFVGRPSRNRKDAIMRPGFGRDILILGCACLALGCSTTSSRPSFTPFSVGNEAPSPSAELNLFTRRAGEDTHSSSSRSDADTASTKLSASHDQPGDGSHNAITQALIESELRD